MLAVSVPRSALLPTFKGIHPMKSSVTWEAVQMGTADLISVKLLGAWGPLGGAPF